MQINQRFAASGRGYVRAVYSKRARGFAVPVDLLRAHCRALMWSGSRGRVRDAFAGYLVSDLDIAAFSESRKNHQLRRVGVFGTGFQLAACFGGDLDAPEWILGGSVIESFGGPFQSGVGRGSL